MSRAAARGVSEQLEISILKVIILLESITQIMNYGSRNVAHNNLSVASIRISNSSNTSNRQIIPTFSIDRKYECTQMRKIVSSAPRYTSPIFEFVCYHEYEMELCLPQLLGIFKINQLLQRKKCYSVYKVVFAGILLILRIRIF